MYQKKERGAKPWVIMACVVAAFIWLLYALGNVLTPFIVAAVFGLCFESLGRMAAIEAYPPRTGIYDCHGTGFADIAGVGADYRAYVAEPV